MTDKAISQVLLNYAVENVNLKIEIEVLKMKIADLEIIRKEGESNGEHE